MKTIGTKNVRLALSFFDSLVASVYRFGLGVWGVTVARVNTLDRLFADFIRWLFRFPRSLYISREDEIEEDLKVTPGSRRLGSRVIE
jgi:hypothetical protein